MASNAGVSVPTDMVRSLSVASGGGARVTASVYTSCVTPSLAVTLVAIELWP